MQKITWAAFRRVTSGGNYLPEVDGLRFIAITSVVLLHIYGQVLLEHPPEFAAMEHRQGLLRFLGHGSYGVNLFFAISGFILALPFARMHLCGAKPVRLRPYFLRRITRLEPPYVVLLLLRSVGLQLTATLKGKALLAHLFASLLYMHNFAYAFASRIEPVSWTLEIEVQFYCLAPLLALCYKIPKTSYRRVLLSLAILGAAPLQATYLPGWYAFRPGGTGALNLSILGFIQFFLVGLLVADFYTVGWQDIPQSWAWDLVSVPAWYLYFWLPYHAFQFVGPLVLPILFVGSFKGKLVRSLLRSRLFSTIGGMCYSIYLTHHTALLLSRFVLAPWHLTFAASLTLSLLIATPASLVVGALYFRLIERPCMDPRWPQQLIAHFRADPPDPPQGGLAVGTQAVAR